MTLYIIILNTKTQIMSSMFFGKSGQKVKVNSSKEYNLIQHMSNTSNRFHDDLNEYLNSHGYNFVNNMFFMNMTKLKSVSILNLCSKNSQFVNSRQEYINLLNNTNYENYDLKTLLENKTPNLVKIIKEHIKKNIITLNIAFVILLLIVKILTLCGDIKKILKTIKDDILKLRTPCEEYEFIKSLSVTKEDKSDTENNIRKILFDMTETYHMSVFLNILKNNTFVLTYTNIDSDKMAILDKNTNVFNEICENEMGHSQMFLIENGKFYFYDPDFATSSEINKFLLICNIANLKFCLLNRTNMSVQNLLKDNRCIIHVIRCMIVMVESKIRNKKKLSATLLQQYPKNKLITNDFMKKIMNNITMFYFIKN